MKNDRSSKPRGKPGTAPARGGPRKPTRTSGDAPPRRAYGDAPPRRAYGDAAPRRAPAARPVRERSDTVDPYKPARRPARDFSKREDSGARFSRAERPPFKERTGSTGERTSYGARASYGDRAGRGFTVTLDPDVARVFRGDASVNRALRLVLQLMQVVQGPPPRPDRPQRGYQGTPEARGFERKPRFAEEEGEAADAPVGDDDAVTE